MPSPSWMFEICCSNHVSCVTMWFCFLSPNLVLIEQYGAEIIGCVSPCSGCKVSDTVCYQRWSIRAYLQLDAAFLSKRDLLRTECRMAVTTSVYGPVSISCFNIFLSFIIPLFVCLYPSFHCSWIVRWRLLSYCRNVNYIHQKSDKSSYN